MGVLPKSLFSGTGNISENDRKKLRVNSFAEGVETVLGDFLWDGRAAATVGLTLSDDGKKVESGRFITRGRLEDRSIKVAASNIWEEADDSVVLTLNLSRAETFKFTDGGLYSQYADQSAVNYSLHSVTEGNAPIPIMAQERSEWQVGDFCLRQICHVSKSSTAKGGVALAYSVLIYPTSKEQLRQGSDLTASPSWPGLKVCSGEMLLLPRPTTPWGCPVLPILRTNADDGEIPSAAALRHAIGAIMGKAGLPDIMKDSQNLRAKWEHFAENPGEFSEKTAPIAWPKQPEPEPESGKKTRILFRSKHRAHTTHHYLVVVLYSIGGRN